MPEEARGVAWVVVQRCWREVASDMGKTACLPSDCGVQAMRVALLTSQRGDMHAEQIV